jgi:D-alanyl-lipoteichoic acid acyltransferase DltB (MBOAT superfamily)
MLFNSVGYGVFLPVVLLVFWLLRERRTARHAFLLAASYLFYAFWSWKYLGLILFSTLLDYWVGAALFREPHAGRRRLWLAASLLGNLGVLATFKYYGFFARGLASLLGSIGVEVSLPVLDVLLPVGISFYTFQTLSYTIDIHRRRLEPTESLLDFALFVAFFPQLVAGPIVRAAHFLPQLGRRPTLDDTAISQGLARILEGLFKKVVIADTLAVSIVDPVFLAPRDFGTVDTLLAVYAYALQIYCDFSGYSDIAIGSARLLGFNIPENFNAPYLARDLRDFWRRWHISLSTWLRDYLYIGLGGSRGSSGRTQVNLLVTMLLGGLWHGAAWRFVIWGGLHGLGLAATRAWQRARDLEARGSRPVVVAQQLFTFHVVCAGWIFFRAPGVKGAFEIFAALARPDVAPRLVTVTVVAVMLTGAVTHVLPRAVEQRGVAIFRRMPVVAQALVLVVAFALFDAMTLTAHPFIYFQF